MPTTPPSPFLRLPLELREQIYSLYFKPSDRLHTSPALEAQGLFGGVYRFEFDLWRTSRQIYEESSRVWRRENVFVKIATPWPSAGMYRVYLMGETGWGEDEDEGMFWCVFVCEEEDMHIYIYGVEEYVKKERKKNFSWS